MTCSNCGSPAVVCVEADEPQDEGRFTEKYQCSICRATGTVSGREEQKPEQWNRYGSVFEA